MSYGAVIFDLFGTLADFPVRELDRVLAEMAENVAMPYSDFLRCWPDAYERQETGAEAAMAVTLDGLCRKAEVRASPERIAAAAIRWREFQQRILVPRSDAVETVKRLKSAGCTIGLIGNTPGDVPPIWRGTLLAPLFDVAIFSCEVGMRKPDPAIYRLAADQFGTTPQHCLFVGDGGSRELSGAVHVGMSAVQIRVPDEAPETAQRLGREEWNGPVITELGDLIPFLRL